MEKETVEKVAVEEKSGIGNPGKNTLLLKDFGISQRHRPYLVAFKQRVTLIVTEKKSGFLWRYEKSVFNPRGVTIQKKTFDKKEIGK